MKYTSYRGQRSGGVRVLDLAIILLTAAVLLLDKFGRGRR